MVPEAREGLARASGTAPALTSALERLAPQSSANGAQHWTLVCTIRMAVRHQASQVLMSGLVSSLHSSRPIPDLSG